MSITLFVKVIQNNQKINLKVERDLTVFDLLREVRSKLTNPESFSNISEYGIFIPDVVSKQAFWLDNSKTLAYYSLKDKAEVEYRFKYRRLTVRTVDDTKKTLQVDDSKTVAELMLPICSKFGITNHEEYSLIRELDEDERMKTMTMKKNKSIAKDYEKLEKLKQKLHTDDDLNWVSNSKTLRQQSIDEKEILLLRRRYFFSDQNVDSRDPVQLNLLYVQLKNAILNGAHPITQDEAIQLAGIQCQSEFGNHVPEKMKSVHIELKDYLPKEYVKVKGIEKKIFQQHARLIGLSQLDAKVRYAQFCRSLKTYGITFFLVKERLKGKSKLVPRLFGISKESLMRVDEKTKEILQTWPLTTVKRWAASANSFSVDFGEYSESNYVMQTQEGEQIAQLISGYIDIIVKKTKKSDYLGIEGEEDSAMYEDTVAPSKANIISHQRVDSIRNIDESNVALRGVVRNVSGHQIYQEGMVTPSEHNVVVRRPANAAVGYTVNQGAQQFQVHDLDRPKRALLEQISNTMRSINTAHDSLHNKAQVVNVQQSKPSTFSIQNKRNLEMARASISSNIGAMSLATGGLVNMISPYNASGEAQEGEFIDYSQLNTAVSTIGLHVGELMNNVRLANDLSGADFEEQEVLLGAARSLAVAFQDLMKAAQPPESGGDPDKKEILDAASKVSDFSKELVRLIQTREQTLQEEWVYRDMLLDKAREVAKCAASLVINSKHAASNFTGDANSHARLVTAARNTGMATSQLVTCAKVVVCSIEQAASQQQLICSCKIVNRAVEDVLDACVPLATISKEAHNNVDDSARNVQYAVDALLQHIQDGSALGHQDSLIENIISANENLTQCMGDGVSMLKHAQILGKAGTQLTSILKQKGEEAGQNKEFERERDLLQAANKLGESTSDLVMFVKSSQGDGIHDPERQVSLLNASKKLISVINSSAGDLIRRRITDGLEFAGRAAAISAGQLVLTSQEAAKKSRASNYQFCQDASEMKEKILPQIAFACHEARTNPEDAKCQNDLMAACQELVRSFDQLLKSCQALCPTVRDTTLQSALTATLQQSQVSLGDLKHCVTIAEYAIPEESPTYGFIDADDKLRLLLEEDATVNHNEVSSVPLSLSSGKIGSSVRDICINVKELMTALAKENEIRSRGGHSPDGAPTEVEKLNELATSIAEGMENLVHGLRITAANRDIQAKTSVHYQESVVKSNQLATLCREFIQKTSDAIDIDNPEEFSAAHQQLIQMSDRLTTSLNECLSCIPGHSEVDQFCGKLTQRSHQLVVPKSQRPRGDASGLQITDENNSKHFHVLQTEFKEAADGFNQIVFRLTSEKPDPLKVSSYTIELSSVYDRLMDAGEALMDHLPSVQEEDVSHGLQEITTRSVNLMDLLRNSLIEGVETDNEGLKHSLWQAASALSQSVNQMLASCTSNESPVQRKVNASRQQLEALKMSEGSITAPTYPVSNDNYLSCLSTIDKLSLELGNSLNILPTAAKEKDSDAFCDAVKKVTESTASMINLTTQAAYLVGASDPRSEPGKAGYQDYLGPVRDYRCAIQEAADELLQAPVTDLAARNVTNSIVRNVGSLCQTFKVIIANHTKPSAKRKLVEEVKMVAQSTAALTNLTVGSAKRSSSSMEDADIPLSQENLEQLTVRVTAVIQNIDDLMQVFQPAVARDMLISQVPAKIADEAKEKQLPLIELSHVLLNDVDQVIEEAGTLAEQPSQEVEKKLYTSTAKLTLSVKHLQNNLKESTPGLSICQESLQEISQLLKELDQAELIYDSQTDQSASIDCSAVISSIQMVTSSLAQISNLAGELSEQAKSLQLEKLSHSASQLSSYMQPLVQSSIKAVSCLKRNKDQHDVIELSKTVLEAASEFISNLHRTASEPEWLANDNDSFRIDETRLGLTVACEELTTALNELATKEGDIDNVIKTLNNSSAKLDESPKSSENAASFADNQFRLVHHAKALIAVSSELLTASSTSASDSKSVASLAGVMAQEFNKMAHATQDIRVSLNSSPQMANKIKLAVQSMGQATGDLIRLQLPEQYRVLNERFAALMSALQASACGTQACIRALGEVNAVVADLDMNCMFATSGTLSADTFSPNDQSSSVNESSSNLSIEDSATKLHSELSAIFSKYSEGSVLSQEEVAQLSQSLLMRIQSVTESTKQCAIRLGSDQSASQVSLISAARDCASTLIGLLDWCKSVAGGSIKKEEMNNLRNKISNLQDKVESLRQTAKTVEDESSRGTRTLKLSLDSMNTELKLIDKWNLDNIESLLTSQEVPEWNVMGENVSPTNNYADALVHSARMLLNATTKAVTASNSLKQDDIMVAANAGSKAVSDLSNNLCATLRHHLRVLALQPTEEEEITRETSGKCYESAKDGILALNEVFNSLLMVAQEGRDSPAKSQITLTVRKVALAVNDLTKAASDLKSSQMVDATAVAEDELLGAASQIEAAARKLAQLRPRKPVKVCDDEENMSFDAQILNAAQLIVSATGSLVKAATEAQKELVLQGKMKPTVEEVDDKEETQWSQGLISAARMVAAATHNLCEAANVLMQNSSSGPEKLISASKQVASSTAHLLVACQVKADPDSKSMMRLREAGGAVKRATEMLVKEAQASIQADSAVSEASSNNSIPRAGKGSMVDSMKQIIQTQADILAKENELKALRGKLTNIRQEHVRTNPELFEQDES